LRHVVFFTPIMAFLPEFFPILHLFYPFSLPFLFSLFLSSPFLLFLLHFPPFLFPFTYFFPQMTLADIPPPPGRDVF
jgi:hypothetical protein